MYRSQNNRLTETMCPEFAIGSGGGGNKRLSLCSFLGRNPRKNRRITHNISVCYDTRQWSKDRSSANRNHNRIMPKGESALSFNREMYTISDIKIQTYQVQINV